MEKEASEGRLDDDQVPPMVIRSDTIAYALHAEVAHFHDERQRDFKKAMTSFLTEQINFYQKVKFSSFVGLSLKTDISTTCITLYSLVL